MLARTHKVGQQVIVDQALSIEVVEVKGSKVRLCFRSASMQIFREKVGWQDRFKKSGTLVLTLTAAEGAIIGYDSPLGRIVIIKTIGDKARLGFDLPKEIGVRPVVH